MWPSGHYTMNDAYRRLRSLQPPREAAPAVSFASDARSIRQWIDALPMANFRVATGRMIEAMQALARQRLDGAQRLEALEALRGSAMQLAAATSKQIIGSSFPLPPQKAELGDLALQFQHALASGYRTALVDLCAPGGSMPFLRGKQVALAATRALQHGGEHLAMAYLIYRTPPSTAWQALHDVYGFASSLRIAERDVDDPVLTLTTSAHAAYVQSLLMALANPYRFTQREQGDLLAFSRTLAPHARLAKDARAGGNDVLVATDSDTGPGYVPDERVQSGRDVLALQVDAVLAFIDAQLDTVRTGASIASFRMRGGPTLHLDVDLARRLASGWRERGTREHARLGGGYALDSVLGLHDLHVELAGGDDFERFMQRVRGEAINLSEADRGASWRHGNPAAGRAQRLPVRVLDQSLGGYRLLWERGDGVAGARARVSELVGLALPDPASDAQPDWMVGVIRWIRIDEQERVDAGVELLARRALPVGLRIPDAQRRATIRGVLLAPLDADRGEDYDTLLAPTEVERSTASLEVAMPADMQGPPRAAGSMSVGDLRLRDATGIYQHFELSSQSSHSLQMHET